MPTQNKFNLPTELDIQADEDFTKERLDRAWAYILQRLLILDSFKPTWDEQVELLRRTGLNRLNETLQPIYDSLVEIANIGVIFSASSTNTLEIGTGLKTFVVSESDRQRFAPTMYLAVSPANDFSQMMFGTLSSYDRATGTLIIGVETVVGSGEFSDWKIAASAPFDLHARRTDNPHQVTAHQVGSYTQGEIDQKIADAKSAAITSANQTTATGDAATDASALAYAIALG